METIYLNLINAGEVLRIKLLFDFNSKLNGRIKKFAGARWSRTLKCWYIACTQEDVNRLQEAVAGLATVNGDELRKELTALKLKTSKADLTPIKKDSKPHPLKKEYRPLTGITDENRAALAAMADLLVLKAYSASTARTYKNEFGIFLQSIKQRSAQSITPDDLKSYLLHCLTTLKLTENTVHSRLNALKFYYEQVLKQDKFFFEIPRPKKALKLPKVISEEKILEGLLEMDNLKHKTILLLAYSAGLRVSEVVNVKINDIDSDRMQININGAKGKKDRVVTLSSSLLPILRAYYEQYRPKTWLFEGQFSQQYSSRSAQLVFKQAFKKLHLPAQCSFHSLRHSFATHLLESGTDISFIQKLLGHNDIKTTLRYTQITKKDMTKVESPLDKAMRKKGL